MRGPYYWELEQWGEGGNVFAKTGCDPLGEAIMRSKSQIIPLFLKEVKSPAANILKQQMLSLGGEAVVGRGVIDCSCAQSDVLLLGTRREYEGLMEKMAAQPWGLKSLGEKIRTVLDHLAEPVTFSWEWPGQKLVLGKRTLVMGILNLTPDSFSDGGKFRAPEEAVEQAWAMKEAGADIIDIGGESTRPGYQGIPAAEELKRVVPVLKQLVGKFPLPLSIDTYKAVVAEKALSLGVQMVNDISGGLKDPGLPEVVTRYQAPVIVMHNFIAQKYQDLMPDLVDHLRVQVDRYLQAGLPREKIVIDPGIGFCKDSRENLVVLQNLATLRMLGYPILLGVSRKSFLGETLGLPVNERLEGSLAAAAWGVNQGVHILRVHDVPETVRLVRVWEAIRAGGNSDVVGNEN